LTEEDFLQLNVLVFQQKIEILLKTQNLFKLPISEKLEEIFQHAENTFKHQDQLGIFFTYLREENQSGDNLLQ